MRDAAPIRAVAIDLDGTLLDTVGEIAAAVNGMLERLQAPGTASTGADQPAGAVSSGGDQPAGTRRLGALPVATVRNMVGKGLANLIDKALAAALGSEPTADFSAHALAVYQECYFALLGTSTVAYPGVMAGLHRMRAMHLSLACVTNKATRFTLPLLERTGIDDYFAHVVCGDTYEERKPHPLPLLKTAERFGCAPCELLMIGDSVNDVAAARAAGCPVLCVPYGYNEGEPVDKLDFDGMIADLTQACDWIDQRSTRTACVD